MCRSRKLLAAESTSTHFRQLGLVELGLVSTCPYPLKALWNDYGEGGECDEHAEHAVGICFPKELALRRARLNHGHHRRPAPPYHHAASSRSSTSASLVVASPYSSGATDSSATVTGDIKYADLPSPACLLHLSPCSPSLLPRLSASYFFLSPLSPLSLSLSCLASGGGQQQAAK